MLSPHPCGVLLHKDKEKKAGKLKRAPTVREAVKKNKEGTVDGTRQELWYGAELPNHNKYDPRGSRRGFRRWNCVACCKRERE